MRRSTGKKASALKIFKHPQPDGQGPDGPHNRQRYFGSTHDAVITQEEYFRRVEHGARISATIVAGLAFDVQEEEPTAELSKPRTQILHRALYHPPAARLGPMMHALVGPRMYTRLFEQGIRDHQDEWQEAHASNRVWLARWVKVRCQLLLLWTLVGQMPFERVYKLLFGGAAK